MDIFEVIEKRTKYKLTYNMMNLPMNSEKIETSKTKNGIKKITHENIQF